jgi:uncharacterized protein (DUF433 family)
MRISEIILFEDKPKFSIEQYRELAEKWRSGVTLKELARQYKTTPPTISSAIKKAAKQEAGNGPTWKDVYNSWKKENIENGGSDNSIKFNTPEEWNELAEKWRSGVTFSKLAKQYKTTRSTIDRAIKKAAKQEAGNGPTWKDVYKSWEEENIENGGSGSRVPVRFNTPEEWNELAEKWRSGVTFSKLAKHYYRATHKTIAHGIQRAANQEAQNRKTTLNEVWAEWYEEHKINYHSIENKKKRSTRRIQYHRDNPDKHIFNTRKWGDMTSNEKLVYDYLNNLGINFVPSPKLRLDGIWTKNGPNPSLYTDERFLTKPLSKYQFLKGDPWVFYPDFTIGKLIIETDGYAHDPVYDSARDEQLAAKGYTVKRIPIRKGWSEKNKQDVAFVLNFVNRYLHDYKHLTGQPNISIPGMNETNTVHQIL